MNWKAAFKKVYKRALYLSFLLACVQSAPELISRSSNRLTLNQLLVLASATFLGSFLLFLLIHMLFEWLDYKGYVKDGDFSFRHKKAREKEGQD